MAVKPINAVGRRKSSTARVFLTPLKDGEEEGTVTVNKRPLTDYFPRLITQKLLLSPLDLTEQPGKFNIRVSVKGGGITGQAGAVRHALSRVLEKVDPDFRAPLKKAGFITRDSRVVERKKPGRHKARKKPQFSKR